MLYPFKKVIGYYPIPSKSIIVANHPSFIDFFPILSVLKHNPLIVASYNTHKRTYWIAKLLGLNVVSHRKAGLKKAYRQLQNGGSILIFPEGHRSFKSKKTFFSGFIRMSEKTHTNIYPIRLCKRGIFFSVVFQPVIKWKDKYKSAKFYNHCLKGD